MVNNVTLVGNLGAAPEFRATPKGTQVLEFSIAVNEGYRGDDGQYRERPNWFKCVVFGRRAAALERVLAQGMKVAVAGRLHQERWEKDGRNMSSVSVTVADLEIMSARSES